jgi:tyrosine-protein kinase Etk/Wzc
MDEGNNNKAILVLKKTFDGTVQGYQSKVSVSLANKQASVLTLGINDESTTRAEDILNSLIEAYNEDAIAIRTRFP